MGKVSELREKYRPKQEIKYLLVAESPPDCEGEEFRFFYNPDNEKYDSMFRNIMEVVFPEFKSDYRRGMKHSYLERFCRTGFFMIDATDQPVNRLKGKARLELIKKEHERKLLEIQSLVSKTTPIFLITKSVFSVFYAPLTQMGYNLAHHELLPFPGQGHQTKFKELFQRILGSL